MNTKLFSLLMALFFIFGNVDHAAAYSMVEAPGVQPVAGGFISKAARLGKKGAKAGKARRASGVGAYAGGAYATYRLTHDAPCGEASEAEETVAGGTEPEEDAAADDYSTRRNAIIGILSIFSLMIVACVYSHFASAAKEKARFKAESEEILRRVGRPRKITSC